MKKVMVLLLVIGLFSCDRPVGSPDTDQNVMSTLWYQRSAEARALYYQGYNLAQHRIQLALDTLKSDRPLAVITDIDETVLDNSPSEGKNILDGVGFSSDRWNAWTEKREAVPLPGSLEFAQFLQTKGITLFYISNRSVGELDATIDNLKKWKFPYADQQHVLLKSDTSDKTERRQQVFNQYEVLLLLGDNLNDFTQVFGNRDDNFGFETTDQFKNQFGTRFIVFPNPMYGSWTKPIEAGLDQPSATEHADHRRSFLIDY